MKLIHLFGLILGAIFCLSGKSILYTIKKSKFLSAMANCYRNPEFHCHICKSQYIHHILPMIIHTCLYLVEKMHFNYAMIKPFVYITFFTLHIFIRENSYSYLGQLMALSPPVTVGPPEGDFHIRNCKAYCHMSGCAKGVRDSKFRCHCSECDENHPFVVSK